MAEVNSVNAIVKDGKVTNLEADKAVKNTTTGYDKDSFMQILVAQMKYQDPLQPTSNTEYIAQYAQFSQVEQLSNMANAMALSRASEMVGKTVLVQTTNADTGKTVEVTGVVDYVTYSGNKAYLSINGTNYDIESVSQVYDPEYTEAIDTAKELMEAIDKLPSSVDFISDEEHGLTIDTMYEFYTEHMSDKAKKMMNSDYVTSLQQYVNRLDEMRGDEYRSLKTEDAKKS
jgi:flagellar basal-body rod modification protein FlgD